LCDYCLQHGAGRKWFLNIRNYTKEYWKDYSVEEYVESWLKMDLEDRRARSRVMGDLNLLPEEKRYEIIKKVDANYRTNLHHQVVTRTEALEVLSIASSVSEGQESVMRFPCVCRVAELGSDPALHCFAIAFTPEVARRIPKYSTNTRFITPDEAAEELVRLSETENVIHGVSALRVPYIGLICNCDKRVCSPYSSRAKLGVKVAFYKGESVFQVDTDRCTGCGACEQTCQMNGPEIRGEKAYIDPERCFGCGNCSQVCPEDAIYPRPRENLDQF